MLNAQPWPRCFDDLESYEEWVEAAREAHTPNVNCCVDCIPEFQAEMIEAGRCEHPNVTFSWESRANAQDSEFVGRRPR